MPHRAFMLLAAAINAEAALAAAAGADLSGRWEGEARIPGAPLPIVLDLARPTAGGPWAGCVTLPGRGVKGAALDSLAVAGDGGVDADLAKAFGGPPSDQPTRLAVRLLPDGQLDGSFRQGGLSAGLTLRRSGDPQLDAAPGRTPLPPAMAGIWRGQYELGGSARVVTMTLNAPRVDVPVSSLSSSSSPSPSPSPSQSQSQSPSAPLAAAGELLIVGKRRTVVAVDRVDASERFITLEASEAGIRLEGRWDGAAGSFDGVFMQGPFEAPLRLQRDAGSGK
jgi:hypothetical protein